MGNYTRMSLDFYKYDSPLGGIYCVFDGDVLLELSIGEMPEKNRDRHLFLSKNGVCPYFFNELDAYFAGALKAFRQRIKFTEGTAFQQKVWRALKEIRYGETRTYRWIAEKTGTPAAVRAAGQALGKNPLPIVLPCHRVIASDGSLGGYSGGVEVKRWLLEHEKRQAIGK